MAGNIAAFDLDVSTERAMEKKNCFYSFHSPGLSATSPGKFPRRVT